jgi:RES domain-containing protein
MKIYRMVLEGYQDNLRAPGAPGRWNSTGKMVIYASESRSLSCLENIVHRSTEGLIRNFFILVLEIPDRIQTETLKSDQLPDNWNFPYNYQLCQRIGDEWIISNQSCLLKVPSAIIHQEFNYMINVKHPDFTSILIREKEKFLFDPRIFS